MSTAGPAAAERGFLLHVFHRQHVGATTLFGVGRLESGETFAVADGRRRPAFFMRCSELPRARPFLHGAGADLNDGEGLTTMDGEAVVRISHRQLQALRRLAEGLHGQGLRTYEADLAFPRQALVELGVRGGVCIRGPWRPGQGVDRVYLEPELTPADWEPELTVLALDIETTPDAARLLACSLVLWRDGEACGSPRSVRAEAGTRPGAGIEEVHVLGTPDGGETTGVCCHASERDLLAALAARVRQLDPDLITGWNVIDFDLTVLQRRFRAHGLSFNLGRSSHDSWYREGESWGGSRVVVYGRQVADALHWVRAALARFDDHRLDTVARALLGRGKTLSVDADGEGGMAQHILQTWRHDRAAFADYCLEDARLVRDILVQEDLVRLSLRRAVLTGLPLERAWGSVAAFDFLYLMGLRRRGMVGPTTGVDREGRSGAPGGLVMPTTAGLYRHVFVFDFKSLYPSIIRTFNIDPLAHVQARAARQDDDLPMAEAPRAEDDAGKPAGAQPPRAPECPGAGADLIRAPNGALFVRAPGILPEMLAGFFARRAEARAAGDAVAAQAYKIVMNGFYGVLGTDSCRFADGDLAGAITGFGHYLLRWTKTLLQDEERGTVLYGDTDSLFVDAHLPDGLSSAAAHERGRDLCAWLNEHLGEHVRQRFGLDSHLDLEFEKYYARFFLPPMRGGSDKARAKGYAGLKVAEDGTEEVEIIGMEAVRRDWTDLAHQVQRDLLAMVFRDAPGTVLEARVLAWIDAVRRSERDADLVYRKALRKGVADYTKTVPAHVAAARLLPAPRGTIRYLVTRDGPQPEGHLTAPIDYEHYVEKQIRPIVRTIGQVCDLDVEVALGGTPDLFRQQG